MIANTATRSHQTVTITDCRMVKITKINNCDSRVMVITDTSYVYITDKDAMQAVWFCV